MVQLHSAYTLFLSLLVEAFPFLLIGVLLSSSLLVLIDEGKFIRFLPKNPIIGVLVGSCAGFLFPVCECGNVPVARRLLMQGLPTSMAIAFLLAAPTFNPIVIWSTWVAFRGQPEIVIYRIVFSLAIAMIIALIFSRQSDPRPLLQPLLAKRLSLLPVNACPPPYSKKGVSKTGHSATGHNATENYPLLQSGTFLLNKTGNPLRLDGNTAATPMLSPQGARQRTSRFGLFLENVVQELRELGGMLIIGSAIAASIQIFVPRDWILNLGQGTISSILAMMLLACLVSICSTVDSFFALSFAATFTTSSLLAFLVLGPMIDLKSVGLLLSIFKPRIILYLFFLAAQLTFLGALCHSYFL
jgi:uncharacterized membrane protein YraQ (UPF0718 family)